MTDETALDPQMVPILARMNAKMASREPMSAIAPHQMRQRAREDFAALNTDPPAIQYIANSKISGGFDQREIRIYDALGQRDSAPGLIYFHGGGWIVGDLDTEDAKLRRLAIASKVRIISVDYVLAPEHPFPEPVEDCVACAQSIRKQSAALGINPDNLAIGGASAGVNLALATAIYLRDQQQTWLRFMLLFYGVFDMSNSSTSHKLFGQGFGMGTEAMEFFISIYAPNPSERVLPLASPVHANLSNLPPAFINGAALDVLRDDSRDLVTKLRLAGNDVLFTETTGVLHGFTLLAREVKAARDLIQNAGQALSLALD